MHLRVIAFVFVNAHQSKVLVVEDVVDDSIELSVGVVFPMPCGPVGFKSISYTSAIALIMISAIVIKRPRSFAIAITLSERVGEGLLLGS